MGAWNIVVGGLLLVLLMPLVEQRWSDPGWQLDAPRAIFLTAILLMGLLNYLPTRLGLPALLVAFTYVHALARLADWRGVAELLPFNAGVSSLMLAGAIWLALVMTSRRPTASKFDEVWLTFRDRYGMVWGLRVLEQFNAAAANRGWTERLTWWGLDRPGACERTLPLLSATLKRFGL
jgi:hypothetical protein